jgi:hypothetical protein
MEIVVIKKYFCSWLLAKGRIQIKMFQERHLNRVKISSKVDFFVPIGWVFVK